MQVQMSLLAWFAPIFLVSVFHWFQSTFNLRFACFLGAFSSRSAGTRSWCLGPRSGAGACAMHGCETVVRSTWPRSWRTPGTDPGTQRWGQRSNMGESPQSNKQVGQETTDFSISYLFILVHCLLGHRCSNVMQCVEMFSWHGHHKSSKHVPATQPEWPEYQSDMPRILPGSWSFGLDEEWNWFSRTDMRSVAISRLSLVDLNSWNKSA